MNIVASIIATLGLDKSEFSRDLHAAAAEAERSMGQVSKSGNIAAESQDRLYTSSHRVAAQMTNVTREMLSGASAGDVFSAALEGAGRSLRLSLGALAGIEIAGAIVKNVADVRAEYVKLRTEVEKLSAIKPDSRFQTLEQIKKQADEATASVEKLRKDLREAATPFSRQGLVQSLSPSELPKTLKEAEASRVTAQTAEVSKLGERNALHDQPEFISKAVAIEEKFLETVQRLGQRGIVELDRELENLAKDIARSRREQLQRTLQEIAKRPGISNEISPTAAFEGAQAREAQREKELAVQARETIGGEAGLQQAAIHDSRAEAIMSGIESLKDSEKKSDFTGDFKNALDSSAMLGAIRQRLEQLSFANQ